MPNYSTNLKTWGDAGSEYPDNYSYIEGEQPVDDWDNFVNSNIINDIEHLINVTNSAITLSAGDGLDGGGDVELTESISLSVDVSDFAGAGVQDDGTNNLQLTNDSLTVSAGDGLDGGGTVSLGGSLSVSIDPSDFAGGGLEEDASNNIQLVNEAVTYNSGGGLSGGGQVSLGGSATISHADTSTQGDIATGGATVIDDIYLDGYGHVYNLNAENRALDDWDTPTSTVFFDRDGIQSVDDWLEIDGSGSGLLLNYKNQNEETRVYGSFQARSSAEFLGSVSGISLGDLDDVTATGEGSGGGFDADTVDGQEAADLGKSTSEVQKESVIWNSGFAPKFAE